VPAGFALRLWNGFQINLGGEKPVCTLQVHTPTGLRALLFRPDSLKLGEACIYGDCDVIGNLRDIFPIVDELIGRKTSFSDQLQAAWCLICHSIRAGTAKHAAKLTGDRHSRGRARRAISYHYDLPVDFLASVA
jgi:cyclopropane-fatty-acyl-phospholipid synthase